MKALLDNGEMEHQLNLDLLEGKVIFYIGK